MIIDIVIQIMIIALLLCTIGYIVSVMKEYQDLRNKKVVIKSKAVSQQLLDDLDLQIFNIGHIKLKTGDIIRVYSSIKDSFEGTVLGAQKKDNSVVLLDDRNDKIVTYKINDIKKLKVVSRYGSLF